MKYSKIRLTQRFPCILLILFLTFLSYTYALAENSSEQNHKNFWLKNNDILIYLEAVTQINENYLFITSDIGRKQIIQDTIKSYLKDSDTFSDYLSAEEYSKFKKSQQDNYVGIGMEIEKNSSGAIVCFPYPNTPAEKAGIKVGDILETIDGKSLQKRSLFTIASMARGKKGTRIILTILQKNGTRKKITVTRSPVKVEYVSKSLLSSMPVIKILAFTRNTQRELKDILTGLEKDKPIIIDLRGNPGGDLYAAIDSAMLFLQKGTPVLSVKTRKQDKQIYKSLNNALNSTSPIYLWQDQRTASAAEVFIAALTQNRRAISIGKKTFGKGTKQDIIELSDGSALVLTTGYLQTPDGTIYHKQGLQPMYIIDQKISETHHYLTEVKAIEEQKVKN